MPKGNPRYYDSSPFDGILIARPGGPKSRRLRLYEALSSTRFATLPEGMGPADLAWLEGYVKTRLKAEREERRLHFGAFALVAVLFFLVFPVLSLQGFPNLGLSLLALLLLMLLVPYVVVYFNYENRVRAMTLGHLRLIEAQAVADEQAPAAGA